MVIDVEQMGGIAWSALYTWVPFAVGHSVKAASHTFDIALAVVGAAIIVSTILLVRRKADQLGDAAEAAFPGPLPER